MKYKYTFYIFSPIGREDREKHISSCEQLGVPDKLNWSCLSGNTNIPVEFFLLTGREDREKYLALQSKEMNIKVDWIGLSGNTNIPVTFFEKHISYCEQRGVPDKINWSILSGNTNIPYQFFEKHISSCEQLGVPDKVDWYDIIKKYKYTGYIL